MIKERCLSAPVYETARRQGQKAEVNEGKYSKERVRHAVIPGGMQAYAAEGRVDALGGASGRT
jgi:hypothetical protein